MKRRIHQNVWGNWAGYLGTRRAVLFYNTACFTQEGWATLWLTDPAGYEKAMADERAWTAQTYSAKPAIKA